MIRMLHFGLGGIARSLTLPSTLVAGVVLVATPVFAQSQSAGTPGEWLTRYTSARTLGMGGAYVAQADDPLGVLWNPAGLSGMEQNEVRFEHARLFEETSMNSIGFAVPGSRLPSLGVMVLSMRSGEFQRTNDMNDDLGTFRDSETAYLLTASRALTPRLAIGANFKVVTHAVEDFSASGFGVDLGGTFDATPSLRIGASLVNVGGPKHTLREVDEAYPLVIRGGFAATLFEGRGLIAAQVDQSSGPGVRVHAGGEYWIQPALAVRAGYDQSAPAGGFSYRFHPQYQFDYGVSDQTLGLTHRVGLSYRFGGFFASSSAEPEVFSPTGEKAVTRFTLNSRTKAEPREWTLDILGKSGEVARRFGGKGQPPSHIQWDGKDESGMPLPDGQYRYRLVVIDSVGRVVESPDRMVEIATGGPQGTVPVLPVNP
ncbi:MAG: PorV/PorQ family protein [Candidatus Eiseniibacteriota bacterium]